MTFKQAIEEHKRITPSTKVKKSTNQKTSKSTHQPENANHIRTIKGIKGDLAMIKGIDENADFARGYTRALFVSSIYNRLKTLNKTDKEAVSLVLADIKKAQKNNKKPYFTDRHGIWTLGE